MLVNNNTKQRQRHICKTFIMGKEIGSDNSSEQAPRVSVMGRENSTSPPDSMLLPLIISISP